MALARGVSPVGSAVCSRSRYGNLSSVFAATALAGGCASPCPPATAPVQPWEVPCAAAAPLSAGAATPAIASAEAQAASADPNERERVAVLPIEDDELFRHERAALRAELAVAVARVAPAFEVVPVAEVDAALRPVSSHTGALCAFTDVSAERTLHDRSFLTTKLTQVSGVDDAAEELWLDVEGSSYRNVGTWTALWDYKLERMGRYRAAFAAFGVKPGFAGILGSLVGRGDKSKALVAGPIELCEEKSLASCSESSSRWQDRAGALAHCFAGRDEVSRRLLVESGPSQARCEIVDLADPSRSEEACLCDALITSAAMRATTGRRHVRVRFEAPDLRGKLRPELRVVDATTNLLTEHDWRAFEVSGDPKPEQHTVHRLAADNLDALAAPLARCAAPAGTVVVASLSVRENGTVSSARVIGRSAPQPLTPCVERALARGAFACTSDGNPATVRLAIEWPTATR